MKKVSKGAKSLQYHTVITELDKTLPRRNSKKPHLYVGTSLSTAEDRLGQLQRGAGPKFAKGHYLSVVRPILGVAWPTPIRQRR